jgi:hypothetical protein
MTYWAKRRFVMLGGIFVLVALCLVFPKILEFVELAARELRYLWWLILILILGLWLAFFMGRNKE